MREDSIREYNGGMKINPFLLLLLILALLVAGLPAHAQTTPVPVAPVAPVGDTSGSGAFGSGTSGSGTSGSSASGGLGTTRLLQTTPTLACPGAPRTRLIVRERARVTVDDPAPLNMRKGAGTTFDVIETLDPGAIVFVLEGPQCSQRYAWYLVEYEGVEGWIAEGAGSLYFVEVYPPE